MDSSYVSKTEFPMENAHSQVYVPQPSATTITIPETNTTCRKKLDFDPVSSEKRKYKSSKTNIYSKKAFNHDSNSIRQTHQFTKVPSNTKRNARERKRVRTINDYFNQLQKYLPFTKPQSNSTTPGPKKLSKVETLKAAIEFIEYLQQYAPSTPIKTGARSVSITSSPNSLSSNSLQSSPTTSTASFTSNMCLVEKLKIKCESPSKTNEKPTGIKSKQAPAVMGPHILATYDSSLSGYNNTNSFANTPNSISSQPHGFNGQHAYSSEPQATPTDAYYNYNVNGYHYPETNCQTSPNYNGNLQLSPSVYPQYNCQMSETKVYKTGQQDLNSSPTYSTSSSECYGNYGHGMLGSETGNLPVDYNNNSFRYNDQPATNFQYNQYNALNSTAVQYC